MAASYKVTKISRSIGVDYRDKSERGIKWGKKEGGEEENKRNKGKRKKRNGNKNAYAIRRPCYETEAREFPFPVGGKFHLDEEESFLRFQKP